jgi:hypothetical protein
MEDETIMPLIIPKTFYRLILLSGVLFYISWLAVFGLNRWNDVGVYSIAIVLIGFGLVGSFVYDEIEKKEREEAKED